MTEEQAAVLAKLIEAGVLTDEEAARIQANDAKQREALEQKQETE